MRGGAFLRSLVYVVMLTLTLLSICCTLKILHSVYRVFYPASDIQRKKKSVSMKVKIMVICSAISSVAYSTALVIAQTSFTIRMIAHDGWTRDNIDKKKDERVYGNLTVLNLVNVGFLVTAYTTLLILMVERLNIMYEGTIFMLSDRTVWFIRSLLVTLVLLMCIAVVLSHYKYHVLAGLIAVPMFIIYPGIASFVCFSMVRNTRILISETDSRDSALSNVSLRLALVQVLAVSSTMIAGVGIGMEQFDRGFVAIVVRDASFMTDAFVNNVCILLTFKSNLPIYQFFFGRIHQYFLDKFLYLDDP